MKTVVVATLALLATVAVIAQSMRPGRYEITQQMQMANMQMPEMKLTQCVTPEQAKEPASMVRAPQRGRGAKDDCKTSDYKMTGKTATWTMTCTSPDKINGTGEMTFGDDSYTGTMKMVMAQGEMTMKMSGKRIGDCTP